MKNKILLFLILLSSISFAQVSNGGEQEFDYGIKNNASTEIASPPFLVSQGIDGTYGKMNRNNVIEYLEFASAVNLPINGVEGKLYLTKDNSRLYRWNGTIYVEVTADISTKENTSNKQNSLDLDGTGVKFPTVDAVNSGLNEAVKNSDIKFNYIQQNVKNPILSVSTSGWDTKFREIGNVIKVNGRYILVYSGFTGTYTETSAVYCGIATSTDGVNWVKGGINNDGLSYTDVFNEDNYIVYNNGTYYIYSENKSTIPQTISLHTSTDLVNFINVGDVLTNSVSGFDKGDVSSPTVFIENGVWKMIYEGRDFTGSVVDNGKIGIATSTDGVNWVKSPTPIIGTTLTNGFWAVESIVPDDIVKIGDTYYLSYHGRAFNADIYRCGMAYSQDLVNWKDYFGSPILKDGGNTQDVMFFFDGGLDVIYYSTDRESILRAKLANKSFNYWNQSGADIENSNSGDVIIKKALKLTRNDGGNALLISNGVDTDLLVNTTPVGAGNKYVGFSSTVPNRAIVLNEGNGGFIGIGKNPTERLDVNGNVKANTFIGSAELTGTPTAPTPTTPTSIANKTYVDSAITTADAGNVKTTGNQTIIGTKTFVNNTTSQSVLINNNSTAIAFQILNAISGQGQVINNNGVGVGLQVANNNNTGTGIFSNNTGSGTGIRLDNASTGNGVVSNVTAAGTGFTYVAQNNSVNTFTVDKFGAITSNTLAGTGTRNVKATSTGQLTTSDFVDAKSARFELSADINLPISTAGSVSVVDFDSSVFNNDTVLFSNNGSGVITCNRAGIYLVTTSVVLESPLATALTRTDIGIRKNGTTIVAATTNDSTLALGNNVRSMTTTTIINLAANDTIATVVNLFGADATGRAVRLPSLFGTTATQVSNISIQKLEL